MLEFEVRVDALEAVVKVYFQTLYIIEKHSNNGLHKTYISIALNIYIYIYIAKIMSLLHYFNYTCNIFVNFGHDYKYFKIFVISYFTFTS